MNQYQEHHRCVKQGCDGTTIVNVCRTFLLNALVISPLFQPVVGQSFKMQFKLFIACVFSSLLNLSFGQNS